ncbi:CPBP family intramembrane glutamic endopeptidase [Rhodohalobacter sp. SW132]|uniref:CPBP family intramembrane glutamic endopeptidase n=1 Tax=Rhodohalobacter sp. SW132 TaxID=2293433 RepID=UPI00131524BF|nr:CPBP family intramembrane glutamic endopeptidase [Rhodohalobacter sp. SW132]
MILNYSLKNIFKSLASQITKWKVHPGWYLLAIVLPFIEDIILLIFWLSGAPVIVVDRPLTDYLVRFSTTLFIAGSLEEFGWRGYLQPNLQKQYSALVSALFIGLIWAFWHFPVVFFGGASYEPQDFIGLIILLPLFSIVIAWLYNSTKKVLIIPMLFHASVNTPNPLKLSEIASDTQQMIFGLLVIGFWILFPIALVHFYGKDRLSKSNDISTSKKLSESK